MSVQIQSKTRLSFLSLLGIAIFCGAAVMVKEVIKARRHADMLASARAELAAFTHGPRQTALLNGRQVALEVPLNAVSDSGAVARGLASESETRKKPDLREIPEKLKQTGPSTPAHDDGL